MLQISYVYYSIFALSNATHARARLGLLIHNSHFVVNIKIQFCLPETFLFVDWGRPVIRIIIWLLIIVAAALTLLAGAVADGEYLYGCILFLFEKLNTSPLRSYIHCHYILIHVRARLTLVHVVDPIQHSQRAKLAVLYIRFLVLQRGTSTCMTQIQENKEKSVIQIVEIVACNDSIGSSSRSQRFKRLHYIVWNNVLSFLICTLLRFW